jgi:hypothetical protein
MANGWWFDVRTTATDVARRYRAARWLVGIEDEVRAQSRLAEEVPPDDRIVRLREASPTELARYGVGPSHLRQV